MNDRLDRFVERIALSLSGWHGRMSPGRQAMGDAASGAVGVPRGTRGEHGHVFRDRVAIVTGGASGIGRALAIQLAAAGARVVVADVDGRAAHAVAASIEGAGSRAEAAVLDVSDASAVRALVEDVAARHGALDYLFNNAGILIAGPLEAMSAAQWSRIVGVNLLGVVHGVQAAYPLMLRQRRGHIVNTSSIAGLAPTPWTAAYAMTKHAIVGLSTSLWGEAADKGVRVSVVCPGFIDTAIFRTGTYLSGSAKSLFEAIGFKPTPADEAARIILRGVAANRAVIVVTRSARAMAFASRMAPGLARWVGRVRARELLAENAEP
ncbi:MAG: SDR family NAD(P)-dependent oxidoreductase [bacterium]